MKKPSLFSVPTAIILFVAHFVHASLGYAQDTDPIFKSSPWIDLQIGPRGSAAASTHIMVPPQVVNGWTVVADIQVCPNRTSGFFYLWDDTTGTEIDLNPQDARLVYSEKGVPTGHGTMLFTAVDPGDPDRPVIIGSTFGPDTAGGEAECELWLFEGTNVVGGPPDPGFALELEKVIFEVTTEPCEEGLDVISPP